MARRPSPDEVKRVNARYHDLVSDDYDSKWGIGYGRLGQQQVVGKLRRALGHRPPHYERALEIGAGTGYFTLNLLKAGVIREAVATDISPGMLRTLEASAEELGLRVTTTRAEASDLPFPDESFDLVFGHAVLHHLPDLERAFAELARVLRPGGTIAFCGEPSRYGDRLAEVPKRAALLAAPAWRALLGAQARRHDPRSHRNSHFLGDGARSDTEASAEASDGAGRRTTDPGETSGAYTGRPPIGEERRLERLVDVHAFTPAELRDYARGAGFEAVRVCGQELAASWFGWANRTLEATAEPGALPRLWYQWAHRGYLALQRLDRAVLEPRLPATAFYNLLLSGRKRA